ncbi:hypothetical protein Bca4012_026384 [Brassica carinata]|uniref:Uncharacterized protein n=1 Tax=Brassica carinata TaxID=52824 RepID=A0A8X8AUK8_BRACI|nr:hypothetical protein Bca52824_023445 [Brassica carinata]
MKHQTLMEGEKSMMKRPMEEVYGSDPAEGYQKGKKETKEHYRALLRLADEHRKSESEWHEASSKAKYIAAKMDLLDAIIRAKGTLTLWLSWKNLQHSTWKPKETWLM